MARISNVKDKNDKLASKKKARRFIRFEKALFYIQFILICAMAVKILK